MASEWLDLSSVTVLCPDRHLPSDTGGRKNRAGIGSWPGRGVIAGQVSFHVALRSRENTHQLISYLSVNDRVCPC